MAIIVTNLEDKVAVRESYYGEYNAIATRTGDYGSCMYCPLFI